MYDKYSKMFDQEMFRITLLLADIITVTNNEMLLSYAMFEPRIKNKIVIIPNAINDKIFSFNNISQEKRIVWRGGEHRLHDIKPFIEDVEYVMSKHRDWMFYSVGCDLNLKRRNHKFLGDFSIHRYFGLIHNLKPSVFVSPLSMNKFSKCKSNIVWQEATISGGVTLSPSWSDFQIGFRYGNFKELFEESITNQEQRESFFNDSVKYIKENLLLSNVNQLRLKLINESGTVR